MTVSMFPATPGGSKVWGNLAVMIFKSWANICIRVEAMALVTQTLILAKLYMDTAFHKNSIVFTHSLRILFQNLQKALMPWHVMLNAITNRKIFATHFKQRTIPCTLHIMYWTLHTAHIKHHITHCTLHNVDVTFTRYPLKCKLTLTRANFTAVDSLHAKHFRSPVFRLQTFQGNQREGNIFISRLPAFYKFNYITLFIIITKQNYPYVLLFWHRYLYYNIKVVVIN